MARWSLQAMIAALAAYLISSCPVDAQQFVYSFKGGKDGANPNGALINVAGIFYGTTQRGGGKGCGGSGCGTVFSLTPPTTQGGPWTETPVYSFQGGQDGAYPQAGVISVGSVLFGTTFQGGGTGCASNNGCGTLFALAPPKTPGGTWTESIYAFQGGSDGANPSAGLIVAGKFFGTTQSGGNGCNTISTGCGSAFGATWTAGIWSETPIYAFKGSPNDGAIPLAGLVGLGGALYGTTTQGGLLCASGLGCGTVFSLTPPAMPSASWSETPIYLFKGPPDGNYPMSLMEVGGTLFGVTRFGGTNGCTFSEGCGTTFAVTPAGNIAMPRYPFKGAPADGAYPSGDLTDVGGTFYGATRSGGSGSACSLGCGTVFALTAKGFETPIVSFTGAPNATGPNNGGVVPNGSLHYFAAKLYGTTVDGGANDLGTVYWLKP